MAELQTQKTRADVAEFLATITDDQRRADCRIVLELMGEVTGAAPAMWGPSIVGFGHYHYKYASGREGDWFLTGFSPRKQALTLYIMGCLDGHEDVMAKLGTFKHGKACLYVKRLSDVNLEVLRELLRSSVKALQDKYGTAPQPAAEKPAVKKPAAKKPTAKKPTAKKPTAKKPATKKPATKKQPTKKPVKRPAAKKPTAKKPTAKKQPAPGKTRK